jgi:hypothetical protein
MTIHLQQFQPRIPVGGLIKNGINKPVFDDNGKRRLDKWNRPLSRPEQIDHWLIKLMTKDEHGEYMLDHVAMEALPKDSDGKCRRLPVFFSSDDIARVAHTQLEGYVGPVRACVGDGKSAQRWQVHDGMRVGKPERIECPCAWLPEKLGGLGRGEPRRGDPECDGAIDLRCSIDLKDAVTLGSVHRYITHSSIGIPELIGSLVHIQSVIGSLQAIPVWLCLKPVNVRPDGRLKRVYTAYAEIRGNDIAGMRQLAISFLTATRDVAKLAATASYYSLPASDEDGPEEESDQAREFHPGVIDTTATTGSNRSAADTARAASTTASGPAGQDSNGSAERPLQEQMPTTADRRKLTEAMGALSQQLYTEIAANKSERQQRLDEIWGRINFGLDYAYTRLNKMQLVEVVEIAGKHTKIEQGITALEAFMFDDDERADPKKRAHRREMVWKRISAGLDLTYGKFESDDADDLLEAIEERLALAGDPQDDGDSDDAGEHDGATQVPAESSAGAAPTDPADGPVDDGPEDDDGSQDPVPSSAEPRT